MTSFRFFGDEEQAQQHVDEAQRHMDILHRQMELGEMHVGNRSQEYPDGMQIRVRSSYGMDYADITCPVEPPLKIQDTGLPEGVEIPEYVEDLFGHNRGQQRVDIYGHEEKDREYEEDKHELPKKHKLPEKHKLEDKYEYEHEDELPEEAYTEIEIPEVEQELIDPELEEEKIIEALILKDLIQPDNLFSHPRDFPMMGGCVPAFYVVDTEWKPIGLLICTSGRFGPPYEFVQHDENGDPGVELCPETEIGMTAEVDQGNWMNRQYEIEMEEFTSGITDISRECICGPIPKENWGQRQARREGCTYLHAEDNYRFKTDTDIIIVQGRSRLDYWWDWTIVGVKEWLSHYEHVESPPPPGEQVTAYGYPSPGAPGGLPTQALLDWLEADFGKEWIDKNYYKKTQLQSFEFRKDPFEVPEWYRGFEPLFCSHWDGTFGEYNGSPGEPLGACEPGNYFFSWGFKPWIVEWEHKWDDAGMIDGIGVFVEGAINTGVYILDTDEHVGTHHHLTSEVQSYSPYHCPWNMHYRDEEYFPEGAGKMFAACDRTTNNYSEGRTNLHLFEHEFKLWDAARIDFYSKVEAFHHEGTETFKVDEWKELITEGYSSDHQDSNWKMGEIHLYVDKNEDDEYDYPNARAIMSVGSILWNKYSPYNGMYSYYSFKGNTFITGEERELNETGSLVPDIEWEWINVWKPMHTLDVDVTLRDGSTIAAYCAGEICMVQF